MQSARREAQSKGGGKRILDRSELALRVATSLRSRRHQDLLAVGSLVLLAVAFLFEMVSMDAVPVARDIQLFFIPHKHILRDALLRGEIPLWTPLIRTGYPVLANFQSGVLYPPHWLLAILPFLTAFNLLVMGHFLLGGVGAYLLARRLDLGPAAAWVAGASFMLGGYFVSLTNLVNALQAAAWTPVMVAVLLHHVRRWSPQTLALAIGVYLMGFLAGEPQTFLLGSCVALAVGLVRTPERIEARCARLRVLATLGIAAAAVAGIAAAQVLPTLEMLAHSHRGGGLTIGEAGRYALAPIRLFQLVVPNDFADPTYRFGTKMQLTDVQPWLFSVYVGVATLVAVWHAWLDDQGRGLTALWVGLSAVGIVLALGGHTPVYPWLLDHVSGLSAFRFPEKYLLLTGLAVPMLAAQGMETLLRRPQVRRADVAAALSVLVAGLGAKLLWVLRPDLLHGLVRRWAPDAPALENVGFAYVEWGENLEIVLGILVASVGLAALYRTRRLERPLAAVLLLLAVSVDFWVAHREMNPVVDPSFYTRPPPVERYLPEGQARTAHRYRGSPFGENVGSFYSYPELPVEAAKWLWQQTLQPNTPALWGVASHGSVDAIHLDLVVHSDELLRDLPVKARLRLLRLGSVKWVFRPYRDGRIRASRVAALDSIPGYVHTLENPLPRAYLARGRSFFDEIDALNWALRRTSDIREEVAILPPPVGDPDLPDWVDEDDRSNHGEREGEEGAGTTAPEVRGDAPEDSAVWRPRARILSDEGERIEIRVDPDTASYLVLADTWYPGWSARIDGVERRVRRANYFFKAVPVQPGDETVVFRYRSESLRTGAMISGASLLVLLLGLGGWTYRRRRGGAAGSSGS